MVVDPYAMMTIYTIKFASHRNPLIFLIEAFFFTILLF